MLKASPILTIAFVATLSVGSTNAYAQFAQSSTVAIDSEASGSTIGLNRSDLNRDPFTLRDVTETRAVILQAMRPDTSRQAATRTQRDARGRSKKRLVAGAIVGSVGGFFAGGFLGAHIEGDRCNCDDPGVRGFLIGAPIGALAGGILGAKFLF